MSKNSNVILCTDKCMNLMSEMPSCDRDKVAFLRSYMMFGGVLLSVCLNLSIQGMYKLIKIHNCYMY